MKRSAGGGSALLAVLLHLHLLQLGGAVSVRRKQPTSAADVAQLRQVIQSRSDDLANQKNIAHGLQLEVRELQSELQAEKKAVVIETQKEHTLSQKLNRVRAVLDDGASASPSASSKVARADEGLSFAPASSAFSVSISDVDGPVPAPMKSIPHLDQLTPLQSLEKVVEPLPNLVLGDSDLEPPEDMVAQKAPAAPQQPHQRRQLPPQQPLVEESLTVAHAHQTTPQKPPPFFEAAAVQAATATRTVKQVKKKSAQRKKAAAAPKKPKVVPQQSPPARKVALQPRKAKQPVVLRRPRPAAAKLVAKKPTAARPAAMAPPGSSSEANAAVATQDSDAAAAEAAIKDSNEGSGSDFDALEAQLHEEDRRIQDLDQENPLDADGGPPPATGSPQPAAAGAKALPAQPKMELDADAPMEDFLNTEAPGPASTGEAEAAAPPADKDLALAQMTDSTGSDLDSALSDNEFLAQIAPSPRHA